ncbi:MAG: hypothetical protein JZU70_04225 [Chlorobium sp.]|jgi:hypothetical protein|nr:hypothetical protein [Chlorobium sp.]
MKKQFNYLVLLIITLLSGCSGGEIYTKSDFSDVTKNHKKVAILPFTVSYDAKSISKDFTVEAAKKAEKEESLIFQQNIYAQFLKRQAQGKYTVVFQDVDDTNAILQRNGISYDNVTSFTKNEIANKLGVDAVISGTIRKSKPMSTTGAVVMTFLVGFGGNTNRVDISMVLHDGKDGNLLWKYDNDKGSGLGGSPESLAKSLMNNISKNFPYQKEN